MKLKISIMALLVLMATHAWGISLPQFHTWAKKESGKTTKELVDGYDSQWCLANRLLATAMLKKYRNTTIDALRRALSGKPEIKEEEEDWGI